MTSKYQKEDRGTLMAQRLCNEVKVVSIPVWSVFDLIYMSKFQGREPLSGFYTMGWEVVI